VGGTGLVPKNGELLWIFKIDRGTGLKVPYSNPEVALAHSEKSYGNVIYNRGQLIIKNAPVSLLSPEGEDLYTLAREFSFDGETKYACVYVGLVTKKTLPPEVEAKVCNAPASDLENPIKGLVKNTNFE